MNWKIDDGKVWIIIAVLLVAAVLVGLSKISATEAVVWIGSLIGALGLNSKESVPSEDKK